jgi:hypothetical protein
VAYRLGLRLYDARTDTWHDYRKRQLGEEIVHALTVAPAGAPAWATDPEQLWARVEAAERRKDAQVARDYRIPIPLGLSDTDASALAESMARFIAEQLHTAVSLGLHRDADRDALGAVKPHHQQGYHAHLYFPTRMLRFDVEEGQGTGEDGASGMGEKLTALSNKRTSSAFVEQLNAQWATLANEFAGAIDLGTTYEHMSYARLGLDRFAQPTMGRAATALERKGYRTAKGDRIRQLVLSAQTLTDGREKVRMVLEQADGKTIEPNHIPTLVPSALPDVAMITFTPDRGTARVRTWRASDWGADPAGPVASSRSHIHFTPAPTPDPKNPIHRAPPVAGSLLARFISAAPATATALEDEDIRAQAHGWILIIERVLHSLERVVNVLRELATRRSREQGAKTDNEMERDNSQKRSAAAERSADAWASEHPVRMAATRAWAGADAGPAPWQIHKRQAHNHAEHAAVFEQNVARHTDVLVALDEEAHPSRLRQERQQRRLNEAVRDLVALDVVYGPQLLAAANDQEQVWIAPALSAMDPKTVMADHDMGQGAALVTQEARLNAAPRGTEVVNRPGMRM